MHVERVVMEHEKVCVTSLLPAFSLTQVPVQEEDGTGQSCVTRSTAYSGVKKSFHLSLGSDKRHELMRGFLWRMWLRGLVAGLGVGWGGGGVGCEASGEGGKESRGASEGGAVLGLVVRRAQGRPRGPGSLKGWQ